MRVPEPSVVPWCSLQYEKQPLCRGEASKFFGNASSLLHSLCFGTRKCGGGGREWVFLVDGLKKLVDKL